MNNISDCRQDLWCVCEMIPALNPKQGNSISRRTSLINECFALSQHEASIDQEKENEVSVAGFHAISRMLEAHLSILPAGQGYSARKDGQKCTTNLLKSLIMNSGISVTLSRSFSTVLIHEERLDYGFLRAKRALFITVWSVPSMPSGCSPCHQSFLSIQ